MLHGVTVQIVGAIGRIKLRAYCISTVTILTYLKILVICNFNSEQQWTLCIS